MSMCWHKWSKWKTDLTGTLKQKNEPLTGRMLGADEEYDKGTFERQRKECEKCGKSKLRIEKA